MRSVLRSKIHMARVTEANVRYIGSVTIDGALLDKVGIWEGERILITSFTSGARLETYVIRGQNGSGDICMNGPAALHIKKGEVIVIMGFEITDKKIKSKRILVDSKNKFVKFLM